MDYVTPKVYLVSRPSFDGGAFMGFLNDCLDLKLWRDKEAVQKSLLSYKDAKADGWANKYDAHAIVETAARLCYMSFGKGRTDFTDFIGNLLTSKHGSVFEHVNYGFIITGISRSLSHEFVRHRAGFAYSQLSQRYVDESDVNFIEPPDVDEMPSEGLAAINTKLALKSSNTEALHAYKFLVDTLEKAAPFDSIKGATDRRKAVRQAARSVLPNMTETRMFVTANVRAWRHFLEMRGSVHADAEIRRLAVMIWAELVREAPIFFGDIENAEEGSLTVKYSKI